jgi:type VII secretion-associated protein (TIGR03931 family)
VVALLAAGLILALNTGDTPAPGRAYAQYDYRFEAPVDWVQTDDRVAMRQVVIHPAEVPTGDDLVVAQEYVMDYDATADRKQLADALRREADADPVKYSGFNPELSYSGKNVIYYQEAKPVAKVDWYVYAQGRIRIHVGCQYGNPQLRQRVSTACEQIVRTLAVVS